MRGRPKEFPDPTEIMANWGQADASSSGIGGIVASVMSEFHQVRARVMQRCDLKFLAVGVGLDAGVETRVGTAKLNMERACQEESG
jgi:hypothetical protein